MPRAAPRTIFVTVGTTQFTALVAASSSSAFLSAAHALGFSRVLIQHGRGPPPAACPPHASRAALDFYALKPDISADLRACSLCVSHAGAGSVFEALRAGLPLLVACNPALADNHQEELAAAMAGGGHCAVARAPLSAEGLSADLRAAVGAHFAPLPAATPGAFVRAVDAACDGGGVGAGAS
jgi:beta-1,4-N-acetylglucosaminyltransferase